MAKRKGQGDTEELEGYLTDDFNHACRVISQNEPEKFSKLAGFYADLDE